MKKVKRIALVAAAAIVSLTVNAQDALVATLQHGDNMQAFYGGNALKQALEAAQTGDVISLSPGTFNATDITKAVTIQGAGYVQDVTNGRYCTMITGGKSTGVGGLYQMAIELLSNEKGLTIEGVKMDSRTIIRVNGTYENVIFKKCLLGSITMSEISKSWTFDQCRIASLSPGNKSQNLYLNNCIIQTLYGNSVDASVYINHCFIYTLSGGVTSNFKDSFIYSCSSASSASSFHNVYTTQIPSNNNNNGLVQLNNSDFNALFADGEFAYTDERTYELTAAAAQHYLGDDGTQVGIYGGDTPFTDVPTNPQITSRQIATKTDNDGKLSVKITVEAQK